MSEPGLILVTGAGGGIGGVGGKVVALLRQRDQAVRAMVHHDDDRADALSALGAGVVVGDLTRPVDVATALDSVQRMFFSMSLAPSYLEATATVATVARAVGHLDALVAISQMTVSQMDALSMDESPHQRLHWLSEQLLNWSGLPVVHVRPTIFLDSPLFTTLAARSIADSGTIRLPFGSGRTSPIATDDVARVVATILTDPGPYIGRAFDLTGPRSQDMNGIADEYARALAGLLEPGGRLLNHGIARLRHTDPEAGPFSERYVFPDGETTHVSRVILALERAGFIVQHVEEFGSDYAETLRHWIRNLDDNIKRAEEIAGPERLRVWRLYLRTARNGFEIDFTSVYQVLCRLGQS